MRRKQGVERGGGGGGGGGGLNKKIHLSFRLVIDSEGRLGMFDVSFLESQGCHFCLVLLFFF